MTLYKRAEWVLPATLTPGDVVVTGEGWARQLAATPEPTQDGHVALSFSDGSLVLTPTHVRTLRLATTHTHPTPAPTSGGPVD